MKRRISKVRTGFSDHAVEAFRAGDRLALGQALDLKPWEPNPLDVDGPLAPDWARHDGTAWSQAWSASWEVRQQLEDLS
ncbi:hypothetical protein [Mesorhizobium sp. NZP2077]|uniref:hypothetical protein n=1 Tax=Mesorhizobium sp. NZP2077 TaxID=2483404 RepID=UPI0015561EC7|nr:hypothetical protein [Mesorhizobium sp. NZP2077]QKC83950.1 hypothetical protein EB232_22235 [Mesorhizobium sp. NZP2077]QKD17487.1 hypothetical protein HGP13_21940 [Mesorhizobium sp. NZP2077]